MILNAVEFVLTKRIGSFFFFFTLEAFATVLNAGIPFFDLGVNLRNVFGEDFKRIQRKFLVDMLYRIV